MADEVGSIKTAAKRVRYLGSAHSGVGGARAMHITSVALIPLTILFVWILISMLRLDYNGVRNTIQKPWVAVTMLLFVGVGIYHMKLGMQSIIDDYVHQHHLKDWALIANTFFCAVIGLLCIFSLIKVSVAP